MLARFSRPIKNGHLAPPEENTLPYLAWRTPYYNEENPTLNPSLNPSVSKSENGSENPQNSPKNGIIEPENGPKIEKEGKEKGGKESPKILGVAWDKRVQIQRIWKGEAEILMDFEIDSSARGVAWLDDKVQIK